MIPGLIDSHMHALGVAESEARGAFRDLRTIAEIQAWVREKAGGRRPRGSGSSLRAVPHADRGAAAAHAGRAGRAAPRHPVVFDAAYAGHGEHGGAARRPASDPTPPSPRRRRDRQGRQGEPTGLLRNVGGPAGPLPRAASRPDSAPARRRSTAATTSRDHERHRARRPDLAGYRAYAQLQCAGRRRVRATVTLRVDSDGTPKARSFIRSLAVQVRRRRRPAARRPAEDLRRRRHPGRHRLHARAVRPAAAALYGVADPSYRGFLTVPADKIRDIVRTGHRLGWQMCAHVTGDAGVDIVLDAFEAAPTRPSIRDRRFTLIHAYFPTPARRPARGRASASLSTPSPPGTTRTATRCCPRSARRLRARSSASRSGCGPA